MTELLVLAGAVALAVAVGVLLKWRNGRFSSQEVSESLPVFDVEAVGGSLGERATLVQFSSAFCAPCRTTRIVLNQVEELVPGVVAVEVDAEMHLDIVREFNVLRTPTVFVLNENGEIVSRASGAPTKEQVLGTLGKTITNLKM